MRLKTLITVLAAALLAAVPAFSQTAAQKSRRERLEKDMAILDKQIKDISKQKDNAESTLKYTRKKISNRKLLLEESNREVLELDALIFAKEDTIRLLRARLDTMGRNYERLVRTAYRNRDSRLWYMYILSAGNLGQGLRRYGYLKSLSGQMRTQAAKITEAREELSAQRDTVAELRRQAVQKRQKRSDELKLLKKEEGESQKLVDRLGKDKNNYQKQLDAKRKEMKALEREMQRMVDKATASSSGGKKTEIDTKLAADFASNKGKLPWPADGPVTDPFGERYHPVYKNVKLPFNNGINIALSPKTAVKAVFDGKVCQVIVMPGYSQCVLVQHGSFFTFYCKLTNVSVKAGDKIKIGQVIGLVDTISGETELHFELWENKTPQNPEKWLK